MFKTSHHLLQGVVVDHPVIAGRQYYDAGGRADKDDYWPLESSTVESLQLYRRAPGPCRTCRDHHGLARQADGSWKQCGVCFGGYL